MAQKNNTYQNKAQDQRLDNIETHIEVINRELGTVKNDIGWIKKFIFMLLPIFCTMIVSLIYIVLKLK